MVNEPVSSNLTVERLRHPSKMLLKQGRQKGLHCLH